VNENPPHLPEDVNFMRAALDLARQGWGYTSPNPMVGAVVVREGKIVGKGYHEAAGKPHAEINAIANAREQCRGATLYVNLEPCNHFGRTPPCTKAVLEAGIQRVVVGMPDPNPDVEGGGSAFLKSKGLDVVSGVLEPEARHLNEFYIKFITTKKPFVILKSAATLDGRIATRTGESKWITGKAARAYVHRLRHGVDAIMVGSRTIMTDDPQLNVRLPNQQGRDPTRIILDSRLSIPITSRILNLNSSAATILVTGDAIPEKKKEWLLDKGIKVITAPLKHGMINLPTLINRLGYIGITSLLIEGGSRVSASALREQIVDKILFLYGPKIMGGNDGIPIFNGPGPDHMRQCIQIRRMRVLQLEEDFMVEGYVDNT